MHAGCCSCHDYSIAVLVLLLPPLLLPLLLPPPPPLLLLLLGLQPLSMLQRAWSMVMTVIHAWEAHRRRETEVKRRVAW